MAKQQVEKGKRYYTAQEALLAALDASITCTLPTLLSWIEKHELGFQPGGNNSKWFIDKEKFDKFIDGEKSK